MHVVKRPAEMARRAVAHHPAAVVLGLSSRTKSRLELIRVIRAVWSDLPVIVIGNEDSLELERSARQAGIFYYFVHPLDEVEVEAVMNDAMRHSRASRGRLPVGSLPRRDAPNGNGD